jgi:hypothetical protein
MKTQEAADFLRLVMRCFLESYTEIQISGSLRDKSCKNKNTDR